MSQNAKVTAVETYMKALNDADMSLIEALYANDATVEDPYGTEAKVGIEAIKEFYAQGFAAGLKAELTGPVRVAGDSAAFPFNVLFAGNVMEVIDVFQFNDNDEVISMKAYWSEANIKPA